MNKWQKESGFTLLEILIVCVIIGILAAIVVPSYQQYVLRAHRVAAQAEMVEYAHQAERFRSANNSYSDYELPADSSPRNEDTAFYTLEIDADDDSFTITATPAGRQEKDECGTIAINQAGQRTNSSGERDRCW